VRDETILFALFGFLFVVGYAGKRRAARSHDFKYHFSLPRGNFFFNVLEIDKDFINDRFPAIR
jgi:hypothetical protein